MKRILAALAVITWTLGFASASSAAVSVTETVTGTAGDWVHEFTVDNGLPSGFAIYFFGVKMDQRNIVGSPAETDPNAHLTWNNAGYGGSSTVYNNNWIDFGLDLIPSGSSLSGFKVRDTNTVAQTGIQWFAFGYLNGGNYQGDDAFNRGFNPGFEGVVGVTGGIPEPATWALMIGGFGLAGATLRRRKAAIA